MASRDKLGTLRRAMPALRRVEVVENSEESSPATEEASSRYGEEEAEDAIL